MFTGLIEAIGLVTRLERRGDSLALTIDAPFAGELTAGESVAVNGACLTATRVCQRSFTADVMRVTTEKTGLAGLRSGARVNLERALRAQDRHGIQDRLGGHVVTGHVDESGAIARITRDGIATILTISCTRPSMRYIAERGSISVDGVSLTVCAVANAQFSVSIIPRTGAETTLRSLRAGDRVNLEFDIMAKYAERILSSNLHKPELNVEALKRYGFA